MGYGRGRDFVINNGKKISVFILFAGVVFSLFTVSRHITGLTTDVEKIQQNLEGAQDSVNFIMQERESCYSDLNYARDSFNNCQSDLGKANTNLNLCNVQKEDAQKSYSACLEDKKTAENRLVSKTSDYDELAKNSVRGLCCSFSDFQSGAIEQWSIKNNSIVCSGNFTVNCTSGEVKR